MAVSDRAVEPDWFRRRTPAGMWDGIEQPPEHSRDHRDGLRGEMVVDLVGASALVQQDGDWTLRDCEHFSAHLAALADRVARVRASINREEAMQ